MKPPAKQNKTVRGIKEDNKVIREPVLKEREDRKKSIEVDLMNNSMVYEAPKTDMTPSTIKQISRGKMTSKSPNSRLKQHNNSGSSFAKSPSMFDRNKQLSTS